MKKLTIIFVLVIFFYSCSNYTEESLKSNYEGKWKLTKMVGSIPDSETTGSEMEWQEFYLLNENQTFIKNRERNGIRTEITGTYIFINSSDENYIELTYNSESDIIGTCNIDLIEELYFEPNSKLTNTWHYCDGPKLEYEKVN